jgi:hypothetical protein
VTEGGKKILTSTTSERLDKMPVASGEAVETVERVETPIGRQPATQGRVVDLLVHTICQKRSVGASSRRTERPFWTLQG